MKTKSLFSCAIRGSLQKLGLIVSLSVVIFSVFCKPSISQAQVFCPATCMGAGETGRGSIDPMGSHFLNPAGLPFLNSYVLGTAYSVVRPVGTNPVTNTAFMIADNSGNTLVSAAFSYLNKRYSFDDHTTIDQDFSLSMAGRILPKASLGVTGRRLVRQNNMGPGWTKHNVSAGVLIVPAAFLTVGIVGYDMLNDDDLDLLPALGVGMDLNVMNVFKFKMDVLRQEKRNPDKKISLNSGLEFDLGEGFNLKTGMIWDNLSNSTYWTAGLGWIGPNLSAAYAYKDNINIARDTTHSFQLWLNF